MDITWLGHSAFKIALPGATILIDPFITGNPVCPLTVEQAQAGVTHVLLTHGHDDHIGDAIAILKATGAQLTANWEICMWANGQGIENINPMNSGGSVDVGPFTVSLTVAQHSSATQSGGGLQYLGNPHGIVIKAPEQPTLYHAGDTDIFSDMALISEIHAPHIAILPVGDRFTMNGTIAAMAVKRFLTSVKLVIPCHFKTFGLLDASADKLVEGLKGSDVAVDVLDPGETLKI